MVSKTIKRKPVECGEYPENLLATIVGSVYYNIVGGKRVSRAPERDVEEFAPDAAGVVEYLLITELKSKERSVINCRYKFLMSLKETGKGLGVSAERARQIEAKALAKLRRPQCITLLTKGLEGTIADRVTAEIEKRSRTIYYKGFVDGMKEDAGAKAVGLHISELKMSARSFNALMRAGYRTISDLMDIDLNSVPHVGKRTAEEISKKLDALGIPYKFT